MKTTLLFAAVMVSLCFASCTPSTNLYSWYKYEDVAYKYQKRATDEYQVKLLEQYAKMEAKQKDIRRIVPPGFKAEYGFLLYKAGKKEEGIQKLKEEIALYPESEKYIGRIVKQLEK